MISLYKTENTKLTPDGDFISCELRGLSGDTKPLVIGGKNIDNGSTFIEIDTGKIFIYDLENELWKEV